MSKKKYKYDLFSTLCGLSLLIALICAAVPVYFIENDPYKLCLFDLIAQINSLKGIMTVIFVCATGFTAFIAFYTPMPRLGVTLGTIVSFTSALGMLISSSAFLRTDIYGIAVMLILLALEVFSTVCGCLTIK